jgi:O-antigen ligase
MERREPTGRAGLTPSKPATVQAPRPAGRPGHRRHRPADGDGLAKAGIVLGIGSLPVLQPAFANNVAPADLGLVLGIATVLLWAGSTRQRLRVPLVAGVGLMVIAGTIAAMAGDLPWQGAVTVVQDLYLLAWAAALANFGRTAERAGFIVDVWCISAAAWAIVLVPAFGPSTLSGGADAERAGFTFGEQNAAGLYFALSLLVILAARRPRRRRWRAPALAAITLGLLLSGSLAAISGLFAGLAVALVLQVRARSGLVTATAFSFALLLVAGSSVLVAQRGELIDVASQSPNPLVRNSIGRGADSSSERALVNQQTFGLFQTSGFLGRGPVTTEHTLRQQEAAYPHEAHNDWVAALVERGVLGFTGLLLLALELLVLALSIWKPARLKRSFAAVLPAPAYLVAGLVAVTVYSLTHEVLHERPLWTLFGVVAAFGLWGVANRWSLGGST